MIRAFIFDICDTIVRTAGTTALLRLPGLSCDHDADTLQQWFAANPTFIAYEKGQASTAQFLHSLRAGLDLQTNDATLAQAFVDLIVGEIDGVSQLLHRLHGHYPLYALSNNNPLLWQGIQHVSSSMGVFDKIYLSQEIGLLKPDPRAFQHALDDIGCCTHEVVFVDDNPTCIEQAKKMGFQALLFTNTAELERQLPPLLDQQLET